MIDIKRSIILSEGSPVTVRFLDGTEIDTVALHGRANKRFDNTVSLETHRRAQFLPEVAVSSGCLVHNKVSNENWLVISSYPEVIQGQIASNIAHVFVCNCRIRVEGLQEDADDRGKISKVSVIKVDDQWAYIQTMAGELRQYDPGLHPDTEYKIFAPYAEIDLLDKLTVTAVREMKLKIVKVDYMTYEGLVVIQVCSDTRR